MEHGEGPGLTIVPSSRGQKETVDRLLSEIAARSMTLFARIDHAAGAIGAGMDLQPIELIIFGSARAGTPLMQSDATWGLDLPLKVLVYQEADGSVHLGYNEPGWLAERHAPGANADATITAMTAMLQAITASAAGS